ncbi:hypothetical protein TNIN_303201 [Trichonephila inaurata madagascariensis]|uniref:Uncharacterized protein n=1 Tax=Trichonephila inaurata madagascariensis TaxID=2747483 RepID=A0A8X6XR90_9ARAC|nr:hypothetical protein TNIN_303201 [Trichonephila inaurata madagascariensis]
MPKEASRIPFSRLLGRKPEFWGCQGKTEFGVVETRVNQPRDGPLSRKKRIQEASSYRQLLFSQPKNGSNARSRTRWLFCHRVKNRTRHLANFA